MIRALTGIQIGPAPVRVAAEHAGVGLGRQVGDAVFLAAGVDDVGMVGMVARQRADAVRAEELVLVEHLRQHAAELGLVQDGSEPAARDAGLRRVVDRGAQLGTGVEEPLEPLAELGVLRQQLPLEDRGRAQGQQADHRPNLEPLGLAVGQAEHVVEEAVLLVPHARVPAQVRHRRGDPQEVLAELEGHVRVVRIGHRQLDGDLEHVLAEQGHPGGAVGLFQVAAGRQRRAAIEDADVVQAQEAALEDVPARSGPCG